MTGEAPCGEARKTKHTRPNHQRLIRSLSERQTDYQNPMVWRPNEQKGIAQIRSLIKSLWYVRLFLYRNFNNYRDGAQINHGTRWNNVRKDVQLLARLTTQRRPAFNFTISTFREYTYFDDGRTHKRTASWKTPPPAVCEWTKWKMRRLELSEGRKAHC